MSMVKEILADYARTINKMSILQDRIKQLELLFIKEMPFKVGDMVTFNTDVDPVTTPVEIGKIELVSSTGLLLITYLEDKESKSRIIYPEQIQIASDYKNEEV